MLYDFTGKEFIIGGVNVADEKKGYVKVEDIAGFVGVTVRRIQQLTQEGLIKSEKIEGEKGRMYNFLPTIRAVMAYYREKADGKAGSTEAINEAKLAGLEIKLRQMATKASLEEKEAHSTADVRRVWNDVISSFRIQLNSLPQLAAPRLVDIAEQHRIVKILREEIRGILLLLIDYDPTKFFAKYPDYEDVESEKLEETYEKAY